MRLRDAMVRELDLELPYTRKALERAPIEKFAWKPHETAMTLGWLATFLAILPTWGAFAIEEDIFDAAPVNAPPRRQVAKSTPELLGTFDENAARLRDGLSKASDDYLMRPWTLTVSGRALFTQPRWLVLRHYVFNHLVHHRGQLCLYLRMNGVAVPAIYNDSGDEKGGLFRDL